ncbi:hypothetical protein, partial [Chromohalobacter canadensis]|uniref:hypothetical protein n=1 Tax=Chromohalobacter canadensis TaxID=141389 RepID=UPI0035ECD30B
LCIALCQEARFGLMNASIKSTFQNTDGADVGASVFFGTTKNAFTALGSEGVFHASPDGAGKLRSRCG